MPEIQQIVVTSGDGDLCLSASLRGAFTEELLKDLRAGSELVFQFNVELERMRAGWLDESLKTLTHTHTLRFDDKTGVYVFTPGNEPEKSRKTLSLREAEQWMSTFGPLPVVPLSQLAADSPYAIHIQAVLKPGVLSRLFSFRPFGGIHTDRRTIEFRY